MARLNSIPALPSLPDGYAWQGCSLVRYCEKDSGVPHMETVLHMTPDNAEALLAFLNAWGAMFYEHALAVSAETADD